MLKKLSANYLLVMRLFMAFVLGWFGINEILSPRYWSSYVPPMAIELLPIPILPFVQGHGAVLIFLAVCFLFRFYLRYVGVLALLVLLSIIGGLISMNGFDEIVVRDIGLFGLAFSIWLYEIKEK
jgi:hypothetical protein